MWAWLVARIPILNSWPWLLAGAVIVVLAVFYHGWRVESLKADLESKKAEIVGYKSAQEENLKTINKLTADRVSEIDALSQERDNLIDVAQDLTDQLDKTSQAINAGKDAVAAPVLTEYFDSLRPRPAASANQDHR